MKRVILSRAFTTMGSQSRLKAVDPIGTDFYTQFEEASWVWKFIHGLPI